MSNQIYSGKTAQYNQNWQKLEALWTLTLPQAILNSGPNAVQWDLQKFNNIPGLTFDSPSGLFTVSEPMILEVYANMKLTGVAMAADSSNRYLNFEIIGDLGRYGYQFVIVPDKYDSKLANSSVLELQAGDQFRVIVGQESQYASLQMEPEDSNQVRMRRLRRY